MQFPFHGDKISYLTTQQRTWCRWCVIKTQCAECKHIFQWNFIRVETHDETTQNKANITCKCVCNSIPAGFQVFTGEQWVTENSWQPECHRKLNNLMDFSHMCLKKVIRAQHSNWSGELVSKQIKKKTHTTLVIVIKYIYSTSKTSTSKIEWQQHILIGRP